jgi:hypothetical protein
MKKDIFQMKKGRIEMSMLVALIFVVLLLVFGVWILNDKVRTAGSTRGCVENGGSCVIPSECDNFPQNFECEEKNKICCKEVS